MSKIFIGTPVAQDIHYTQSTFLTKLRNLIPYQIQYTCWSFIEQNRNIIAREFLKSDFPYLLFLDSDIIPQPEWILKLVYENKDIISWFCPIFRWDLNSIWPAFEWKWIDFKDVLDNEKVFEVDRVWFWCMLIKREVIEKMLAKYQKVCYHKYDEDWIWGVWEDYTFCDMVKELWYKLYVHWWVPCSHYKNMDMLKIFLWGLNETTT